MLYINFNEHFLLYVFFANDLSLAFYFIFILDYWNDVRHKKIWVIFLFEFKMGHKATETAHHINTHLAQELLMKDSAAVVQEVLQRR